MLPLVVPDSRLDVSEIEKCLVFHLLGNPDLTSAQFQARTGLPGHFVNSIVLSLERKGIIQQGSAKNLKINKAMFDTDIREGSLFTPLNTKGCISVPRPSRFLDLLVEKIDYKCQHANDLHSLHYYLEAVEELKEIIILIKNHFIPSLDETFHEFDATFFSWFFAAARTDRDHPSLDADMIMVMLSKICEEIRQKMNQQAIPLSLPSSNGTILDLQAEFLVDLSLFVARRLASIDIARQFVQHEHHAPLDCFLLNFDNKAGPVVFYATNESLPPEMVEKIKRLMDLANDEPFSFTIDTFKTLNYQFHVTSPRSRGKTQYLQLTVLWDGVDGENVSSLGERLKESAARLQELDGLHALFEGYPGPPGHDRLDPLYLRLLDVIKILLLGNEQGGHGG